MPNQRRVSEDEARQLRREYEDGASLLALSHAHGRSKRTIQHAIFAAGGSMRSNVTPPSIPTVEAFQLRHEYEEGATLKALSEKHGRAISTIRTAIIRAGGTLRLRSEPHTTFTEDRLQEIVARYEAGESQQVVGDALGVSQPVISRLLRQHGVEIRGGNRKGPASPFWKGGTIIEGGYLAVKSGEFPEMVRSNGYVGQHRLVMARSLGRPLTSVEQVHHKNGDKLDNRIENLELRVGPHGNGATSAHCPTCTCFAH